MNILKLLDRPIAFHAIFVDLTGSVNAALMLSQAFYWSSRTKNNEGWFYKTQEEWNQETKLSRYEQEDARKKLRALDFWLENRQGIPAKLFFRIDINLLTEKLNLLSNQDDESSMRKTSNQDCQYAEKPQSGMLETSNLDDDKAAILQGTLPQSNTETTSKTTAETTTIKKNIKKKKLETTIPENFAISEIVMDWANKNNHKFLEKRLEHFINTCNAKGYEYVNWDSAFKNAIAGDWAKLNSISTSDSLSTAERMQRISI